MAKREVTGWTKAEMLQARYEYVNENEDATVEEWERRRCNRKINYQPDHYDGPQRYCSHYTVKSDDGERRAPQCRMHGGFRDTETGLDDMGRGPDDPAGQRIEHGMYAEDANLKDNFSEADERLYDLIMSWADRKGWEEGDPEYLLLEDFALSKVREMRAEDYLNENGEVIEREEFIEGLGKLNTYEEVHPLRNELRLQKKTVLDMMKELGMTPKSKSQMDSSETEASAMEQIADVASEAISDDGDYDPDQFNE